MADKESNSPDNSQNGISKIFQGLYGESDVDIKREYHARIIERFGTILSWPIIGIKLDEIQPDRPLKRPVSYECCLT